MIRSPNRRLTVVARKDAKPPPQEVLLEITDLMGKMVWTLGSVLKEVAAE